MMAHMICPDYIHEIYEYQTEVALKNAELFKQACGDKIQAIIISGTDFGTQNGPFMSLDSFREFYKPYYKKINDWVHANTNWKTFYHTCGAVTTFLQDFYEMGVDILNPVQLSAEGMDGKMLKEQWGDKFTFWGGGVDTQKPFPLERRTKYTERFTSVWNCSVRAADLFSTLYTTFRGRHLQKI